MWRIFEESGLDLAADHHDVMSFPLGLRESVSFSLFVDQGSNLYILIRRRTPRPRCTRVARAVAVFLVHRHCLPRVGARGSPRLRRPF